MKISQLLGVKPHSATKKEAHGSDFSALLKHATHEKHEKPAEKKPEQHATQLAHLHVLMPQAPLASVAPHKATPHPHSEKRSEQPAVAARAPERHSAEPAPLAARTESSAQTAPVFSVAAEPSKVESAHSITAPPPAWAPPALLNDDTARLTLFPHAVNFVTEGQHLKLQVKNGEVSIRAAGELAAALKASDAELRVALAQEGLKLRETSSTDQQRNDDATSDDRRRRDPEERNEEWT